MLALLMAGASAAEEPRRAAGVGTTLTAGSGGYKRLAVYADGFWRGERVDPYASAEFGSDNFINQVTLVAGVWKDLQGDWRVKGGGGLVFGKIKGAESRESSLLLETGIEKDFELPTLGAEYRLYAGTLSTPGTGPSSGQNLRARQRGRAAGPPGTPGRTERLTFNELSGYGRLPAGKTTVGLRLTWGLPSYSREIFTETLSWKVPAGKSLFVTPAVSFEQGLASSVYCSLNLYYFFGGRIPSESRITGPK